VDHRASQHWRCLTAWEAERTRQNGEPEQYVGDRVMEGLVMACQSLCAQALGWLQVDP